MFSGFMVDASNIMKFEGAQNLDSSAKYSVQWWIFKPSMDNKQVWILQVQNAKTKLEYILSRYSFLAYTSSVAPFS